MGWLLLIVLCFVQAVLSRTRAFWPGLILPALHLIFVVALVAFRLNVTRAVPSDSAGGGAISVTSGSVFDAQGNVEEKIEVVTEKSIPHSPATAGTAAGIAVLPLLLVVPEGVYGVIYLSLRRKTSRHSHEADKMALMDLK